jgi:hypothetical protein
VIERRTPLKRGMPPRRSTPDKIREWERRSRRKPIPVMSKKRRSERLTRAEVVLAARQRDGGCVGRGLIPDHHCSGALAGHEVIPRSAWPGGHLVVGNVRTLCKAAHRWVHAHEREAHALGLHGYSWERP